MGLCSDADPDRIDRMWIVKKFPIPLRRWWPGTTVSLCCNWVKGLEVMGVIIRLFWVPVPVTNGHSKTYHSGISTDRSSYPCVYMPPPLRGHPELGG